MCLALLRNYILLRVEDNTNTKINCLSCKIFVSVDLVNNHIPVLPDSVVRADT